MGYILKHTGQEIDEQIDRLINDTVTEGVEAKLSMAFNYEDLLPSIEGSWVGQKYPIHNNGNFNTTGAANPIGYYVIKGEQLSKLASISAFLECDGATPDALAFYTSETAYNIDTYIGGVQHANTQGSWFSANIPSNAKACLICNRPKVHAEPIITGMTRDKVIGMIDEVDKKVNAVESKLTPKEYSEEQIGVVTMDVGKTNGFLAINCSSNEVIKVVIGTGCSKVEVGTSRYASDIATFLSQGTYYLELNKGVGDIYFYRGGGHTEIGEIAVYKCGKKNLFDYGNIAQSFYKVNTSKYLDKGLWIPKYQWGLNAKGLSPQSTDATTGLIKVRNPKVRITVADTSKYKFFITKYSTIDPQGDDGGNTPFFTEFDDVLTCCSFAITMRRQDGNEMTSADIDAFTVEFLEPYVEYYASEKDIEVAKQDILTAVDSATIGYPLSIDKPYFYHFKPDEFIIDGDYKLAIPSQTSFDIAMAARLGFNIIEANIHPTSDGNYICMHGSAGRFGKTVYSLDGTDVSTTPINTKTLAWIKQNIRFNSDYDKYKVAPLSVEEFCKCAKAHGIGVLAGTEYTDVIDLCVSILGINNVIVYNAPLSVRNTFKGVIFSWIDNETYTKEKIMDRAKEFGAPFMFGMGPKLTSKLIEDGTLATLAHEMHQNRFTLASTAVYDTEENVRKAFECGVDFSSSGHQVNPFSECTEVYDLNDANAYTGTATINNGTATMNAGDTLICGEENKMPLGKGMLTMRFNGSVKVHFGSYELAERLNISNDGTKDIVISDYFFNKSTKLEITAVSTTTMTECVYKICKC